MASYVSKHIIIRYVKEVNMFNTVKHPRHEQFSWDERQEAVTRYQQLRNQLHTSDVEIQIAKVYKAGLEDLLL